MKILLFGLCFFATSLGMSLLGQETPDSNSKIIIVLLGPPGSGKGTQAMRLTKEIGIPHISTGDLFRENISKNTELGKRAKVFMDAGKLVPDEIVLDMLFDRVARPDCAKGYLLDGFPRTIPQAEAFEKQVPKDAKLIVLNLQVADDIIVDRISGRRMCKACGNIQHTQYSPPQTEGVCDKCSGELYQRPDDEAPIVKERLRVYHEQTKPLEAFYAKKGLLVNVDGEKSPDEVYKDLLSAYRGKTQ